MKGILKWPCIVAAVVIVLRVIVERAGAPLRISNMLSGDVLITVLGPVYFGLQVGLAGKPRPYWMLLKLVVIYAVWTRAWILPTYWLARIFHWQEPRFGGLDGPSAITGFITLPLFTAAMWIVVSLVIGGAIGSVVLTLASMGRNRNRQGSQPG